MEQLPCLCDTGPSVTVDEWLVGFRVFHVIHLGAVASENKDDDGWNTY